MPVDPLTIPKTLSVGSALLSGGSVKEGEVLSPVNMSMGESPAPKSSNGQALEEDDEIKNLHDAAMKGNEEAVEAFVSAGALDLDMRRGVFRWTPLHLSVKYEHYGVTKLLVDAKATLGIRDSEGMTALDWVERKIFLQDEGIILGKHKLSLSDLKDLLSAPAVLGAACYEAAKSDEIAAMELLTQYGAGIEAESEAMKRAAFYADVITLKRLMGIVRDRASMMALIYPLVPSPAESAIPPVVEASKVPMCQLVCTFMLEIACLNRTGPRHGGKEAYTPSPRINLKVEMMGDGRLKSYKPYEMEVAVDAPVGEVLIKACLFKLGAKSISEEWRVQFDRHQLTLDMDKGCAPLDVTKQIEDYDLKNGDTLLFVPSEPGNTARLQLFSAARRMLVVAVTKEECLAALALSGQFNDDDIDDLSKDVAAVKKRLELLEARDVDEMSACSGVCTMM